MACFLPFNSKNLDISFFTFRPTIVLVDDLVEALKHFSLSAENLGCVHSAIFRSIHGSMIIWYGAWLKSSNEKKESLNAALVPMLNDVVLTMAILIDHCFLDAYAGASRDGAPAAKLINGDTVTMYSATHSKVEISDKVSYACLAIFKSHYLTMNDSKAGVCLKSQNSSRIIGICIWKSLELCYAYILNSDYRKTILPYLDGLPLDIKYDIFRVVYVSGENIV